MRLLFSILKTFFIFSFPFFLFSCRESKSVPDTDDEIEQMLNQMTIEEKAGQMTNISLMALAEGDFWMRRDTVILDTAKMNELLLKKHVGSVQNLGTYPFSPSEWRKHIQSVNDHSIGGTRMKIPILYGIDAVHGANYTAGSTLFPHQLALAATWNKDLAEKCGSITSYELKASGIPWNYAPVLDVSKQPLWGRIFESFGEDTYLVSEMGKSFINGAQGNDISSFDKTAICLKHFIAYGMPYNGKDRSPTYLPERLLRQYYIPPFKEAIDAGSMTVMLNSGTVNGIPSHADYYFITEVLKGELGFEGFTISDWDDITNLVSTHQVAVDEKDAIRIAVNAGMDMCMEPYDASFADYLVELVNEGLVKMERVDDAVRRILKVKKKLGLFESYMNDASLYPDFGSEKFAESSYQSAIESITLLKNENQILPLKKSSKVLLTGVAANSLNYLNGAWSRTWSGEDTTFNDKGKSTILDALKKEIGEENILYTQATDYLDEIDIEKAVSLSRAVDIVVVCLGEKPATEKPSDIDDLNMPKAQLKLVKKLAQTGKPIILVLVEARPRLIAEIEPLVKGIVMAYLPGNEGGRAVVDILYGNENPSGKLPLTYPKYSGSIWSYDHVKSDERDAGFGFDAFDPQFEFGFGLSYTSFEFSDLKLNKDTFDMNDTLEVGIMVTNTGERIGKEVVQLYSKDHVASIAPAVKQLRAFEKIELKPGEKKVVIFKMSTEELQFVNAKNTRILEEGSFSVMIDTLHQDFYIYSK